MEVKRLVIYEVFMVLRGVAMPFNMIVNRRRQIVRPGWWCFNRSSDMIELSKTNRKEGIFDENTYS